MTLNRLKKLCKQWQRLLRISDWGIGVDFAPAYDMESSNLAQCVVNSSRKTAFIKILKGNSDNRDPGGNNHDIESDLVHELLHVQFPMDILLSDEYSNAAKRLVIEQGVDLTAEALIALKRVGQSDE